MGFSDGPDRDRTDALRGFLARLLDLDNALGGLSQTIVAVFELEQHQGLLVSIAHALRVLREEHLAEKDASGICVMAIDTFRASALDRRFLQRAGAIDGLAMLVCTFRQAQLNSSLSNILSSSSKVTSAF